MSSRVQGEYILYGINGYMKYIIKNIEKEINEKIRILFCEILINNRKKRYNLKILKRERRKEKRKGESNERKVFSLKYLNRKERTYDIWYSLNIYLKREERNMIILKKLISSDFPKIYLI